MVNRVKEAFDISVQYPIHSFVDDRHAQCIECIMLAATWTKAITEAEKVLLVDALKNPQYRLLDDFVLQRGNAQRPLSTVCFGNPGSARRFSSVGSPVNAIMEVCYVPLIIVPSYPVHSDCRRLLQVEERFGQAIFVDVV